LSRQLVIGIGGPAYTGVVRIEHACHVAALSADLYQNDFDVRLHYEANTLVGDCRATILTKAIDRGYDLFLSIDSDTWSPVGQHSGTPVWQAALTVTGIASLYANGEIDPTAKRYWKGDEIAAVQMSVPLDNLAMVAFAAAQKNHQIAVWKSATARMTLDDWKSPVRPVWATGFSYCLFNIGWYRRHRAIARRFDTFVDGPSEDYSHCEVVRKAGGAIYAALGNIVHKPWGTDETLMVTGEYATEPPQAA
jgi:hypothetical protein